MYTYKLKVSQDFSWMWNTIHRKSKSMRALSSLSPFRGSVQMFGKCKFWGCSFSFLSQPHLQRLKCVPRQVIYYCKVECCKLYLKTNRNTTVQTICKLYSWGSWCQKFNIHLVPKGTKFTGLVELGLRIPERELFRTCFL